MCEICNYKGYVRVFDHGSVDPTFIAAACGTKIDGQKMLKAEGAKSIKGVNQAREIILEYDDGAVATAG